VWPCHPTGASPRRAGSIHGQAPACAIGCSGRALEAIEGEEAAGVSPKGDERGEVGGAYERRGAIGLAERDDRQVLDCCVDDQSFACGVGILSESRV
jgi:hypothetical protein